MKSNKKSERENEWCAECGRSVNFVSGNYINRIPEFNDPEIRKGMGRRYPDGDYICYACDENNPKREEVDIDTGICSECGKEFNRTSKGILITSPKSRNAYPIQEFCSKKCMDKFYNLGSQQLRITLDKTILVRALAMLYRN